MLIHPYHVDIERQRRREERQAIRRQRLVAAGRQPDRRIRRAVGRSMIRIGSRLAADRSRQWARAE